MGDGQEVPNEFPKRKSFPDMSLEEQEDYYTDTEQLTTIVQTLCWGCGAMIEEVYEGEDNWLFCPCGTGIMKVII